MEIEHNTNYNPRDVSAQMSCNSMSFLSKKHIDTQNILFSNKFNYNDCEKYHNYLLHIDDIKQNEDKLLHGFSINKKSCIYKRPLYNNGDWQQQFSSQLNDRDNLFEYQTKAKTKDIFSCDYASLKVPDNFYKNISCDDRRHFVYTPSFDTDYYSCLR